ncbi:hypothetical protein [Streptomyces sp. NBC_01462]|uniref:hypothetical protein n=1 Tax=Streptomyces sp. NBC_01462 TaxID=2903876 RepID=UPI002E36D581|nr:hypothetical protein [Streptomyces sp. NBC_01462]
MIHHTEELISAEDRAALDVLHARGYQAADIQALARDQEPFAVRVPRRRAALAPGLVLQERTEDLGDGAFTNVFTLTCDLDQVAAAVITAADGFHLRTLIPATALAAVSGSFSFISDDPAYQPAEPCLDFACREGHVVSLPTSTKPAFLVHRGVPSIRNLRAAGTLHAAGRTYRWIGSKERAHGRREAGELTVYGAANCRIRYTDDPRTGFARDVDQAANSTPPDPSVTDHLVTWSPTRGHRVTSVHPGGGTDLFAGSFVLRAETGTTPNLREGTQIEITRIGGLDAQQLDCGISIGPSVFDAAAGRTSPYGACLGKSPFRDVRTARTLVGLSGRRLTFQIFDGAPLTQTFRGITPEETAALCAAAGLDPRTVYHLDGGGSSKVAFTKNTDPQVLGSLHYLKWPHSPDHPFRWQGLDGRLLHSAFTLRSHQPGGDQ